MIAAYSRGDTIIEVLLAITIFSLVSVGGISLMNQGTAIAQRALEIDLVRQQMDAQADGLRLLNREYIADYANNGPGKQRWQDIVVANALTPGVSAQKFSEIDEDGVNCKRPSGSIQKNFVLNLDTLSTSSSVITTIIDASVYAKVTPTASEGLWIQAVPSISNPGIPRFYDFHIRACWHTPGQSAPMKLGTIVRLYVPG